MTERQRHTVHRESEDLVSITSSMPGRASHTSALHRVLDDQNVLGSLVHEARREGTGTVRNSSTGNHAGTNFRTQTGIYSLLVRRDTVRKMEVEEYRSFEVPLQSSVTAPSGYSQKTQKCTNDRHVTTLPRPGRPEQTMNILAPASDLVTNDSRVNITHKGSSCLEVGANNSFTGEPVSRTLFKNCKQLKVGNAKLP